MSYQVTGWHTVTQSEWYFKDSCYNDGPSYWRFEVYSDFADDWGNGFWYDAAPGAVYVNAGGTIDRGGHAVLLIGWDDAKGAYLCKNSWGATGGPNGDGTFWIAYNGHGNDLEFGMSNFDITGGSSTTTTTTTPTTTTTTTTLPQCPSCPANGVITNATYRAGTTCSCSNATSISLGANVTVESGATVTFTAPTITVEPCFHAETGALVNMEQP
jgi:hypothetical protein